MIKHRTAAGLRAEFQSQWKFIKPLLLMIGRWAALATIVLMVWQLNEPLQLPGFDTVGVPFEYDLPAIRLAELSALIAVAAYALSGWPNLSSLKTGTRRIVSLSLIGLVIWSAISIGWSKHMGLAAVQLWHLIIWTAFALMIVCCDIPLSILAAYFLIGTLVHALFGFGQVALQHSLDQAVTLGELPISPNDQWSSVLTAGSLRFLRAYGLSPHPNILGGYVAVALTLSGGLIASARRFGRLLMISAWTIGWLLLLITFSRSAWLAMSIGGVLSIGLFTRSRLLDRRALISIGLLGSIALICSALFAIVFQPFLIGRLDPAAQPLETFSIDQRQEMIQVAGQLILDHPLTGVGSANFIIAARDLQGHPLDWAHNVPLLVASELGLPGLGLFGMMLAAVLLEGLRRWRSRSYSLTQALIAGAVAALLSVMLLDHYLWTEPQGELLWATLLGLWLREQ